MFWEFQYGHYIVHDFGKLAKTLSSLFFQMSIPLPSVEKHLSGQASEFLVAL